MTRNQVKHQTYNAHGYFVFTSKSLEWTWTCACLCLYTYIYHIYIFIYLFIYSKYIHTVYVLIHADTGCSQDGPCRKKSGASFPNMTGTNFPCHSHLALTLQWSRSSTSLDIYRWIYRWIYSWYMSMFIHWLIDSPNVHKSGEIIIIH
jgi:hypothetical protein